MLDEQILRALRDNTIQELDLSKQQLDDADVQVIAAALKSNTSLLQLNLSFNQISDQGAQALAEALRNNTYLQILNLDRNLINVAGNQALIKAIKENYGLVKLKGIKSPELKTHLAHNRDLLKSVKQLLSYPALKESLERLSGTKQDCILVGAFLMDIKYIHLAGTEIKADTAEEYQREREEASLIAETEQRQTADEEERKQLEEAAARRVAEEEKQQQENIRRQAAEAERRRVEEAAARQVDREAKAKRWYRSKLVLASVAVLSGLAAIGLGVSTVVLSMSPLFMFLAIGAGGLSALLIVGAMTAWYQQRRLTPAIELQHTSSSIVQNEKSVPSHPVSATTQPGAYNALYNTSQSHSSDDLMAAHKVIDDRLKT